MILTQQDLELSDVQKRIVDHDSGHLRIVACPGSGKTEVVSRRVAELIRKGVEPSKIVAFTFTEKAAEELKMRIRRRLEDTCSEKSDFGDMYIGTIDSFCLYIIRELRPEFKAFEVLDSARRMAFVDRWYFNMGFDSMQNENTGKWRTMQIFCDSADRVMNEMINTSKITDDAFVKCYDLYVRKLKEERFFDFTSIIYTLVELLKHDESALNYIGSLVKHVVFDEYQDVNKLQESLLDFMSIGSDSVCVVGDDDQNIFQWRGSSVEHIVNFREKYSKYGVTTEELDTNYRATDGLIDVANRLIVNNTKRLEKNMKAYGGQNYSFELNDIVHRHFDSDGEEFRFILDNLNMLHNTDFVDKHGKAYALSYRDMAVIVKTNEDAARIICFFERNNMPCIADNGSGVFERPVVTLAVDCISYVFDCAGYATGAVPEMDDLAERYEGAVGGDKQKFRDGLQKIRADADEISEKKNGWLPNLGLQEFYQRILVSMGSERGVFAEVDLYNLAVLSTAISDYEYVYQTLRTGEIRGFKWFIMQFAERYYSDPQHNDPSEVDAVRILTIWKAKGLEFPAVFVPSFVSRRRPFASQCFVDDHLYDKERYDGTEEDDRRAYYTAITRSQKYLLLTGAARKEIVVRSNPSKNIIAQHPFIDEMKNRRFSETSHAKRSKTGRGQRMMEEGTFPTSYSKMSVYDRCPYDYKLRHVLGFNAGVPASFGYGTNIHNMLNLIHSKYIRERKVPTEQDIKKMFDQMFYLRFAPGRQTENMKKAGMKVVSNYVQNHKDDFEKILDTEKRFEFMLGQAMISGDIDLLKKINEDGQVTEIEIIDFKTDRQNGDGVYDLDYSEQVRLYSYAARFSLGAKPQRAAVHHLDTDKIDYVDISDGQMEKTRDDIESKIGNMLSKNFEALPEDGKCNGCDFRALCSHKGFDVGVGFKPAKHVKRDSPARDDESEIDVGTNLGPSVISKGMMTKAARMAKKIHASGIVPDADGAYGLQSESDSDRSYRVTATSCQCRGFKSYGDRNQDSIPTCSHIEAVKIIKGIRT